MQLSIIIYDESNSFSIKKERIFIMEIQKKLHAMEHWNLFQENRDYTLEEVIETAFNVKFLKENNIDCSLMLEKDMKAEIHKLMEQQDLSDNYEKLEDYVGNEIKKINKMLDIMIGKENRKLIYKKRSDKIFTPRNCRFFASIFASYYEKDSKAFRKGKYNEVRDIFFDFLYKGMKDLADNPNTRLTIDIVDQRWNKVFGKTYRRFLDTYGTFRYCIESAVNTVLELDKYDILLSKIGSLLDICLYEISALDPLLSNLFVFYNDFDEGDHENDE